MAKSNFSREKLSKIGLDTAKIIMNGTYVVGNTVNDISKDIENMINSTKYYRYKLEVKLSEPENKVKPKFVVSTKDTLKAVEDQINLFGSSCALNFASAKNPGGGFLTGSNAQEESLCYRSTLYGSLREQEDAYKYSMNHLYNGLYCTWAIYSPHVSIIRDSEMKLIHSNMSFSAITCPAPNRSTYRGNSDAIKTALYDRCKLIIEIAALNGEKNLVLGAFGCGVFKNDPKDVADAFYVALVEEELMYHFENIEFAILGNGMDSNFRAFNSKFKKV